MKTIFTLFLCCAFYIGNAQNLIAVEHNSVSTFYTTLDSAVNAAQTGDNVYVPGGNFTLSVNISKGFNLIGVGYNPDSTVATAYSQITAASGGYIHIISGADNGSITGIYFYNTGIQFGNSPNNQTVNNYTVSRCWISNSLNLGYSNATSSTNLVFNENVLGWYIEGREIKNCIFSKNIIGGPIEYFSQGNQFLNNVFLYTGYLLNFDSSAIFKNNVFLTSNVGISNYSVSNIFYNNLFVANMNESYIPGTGVGDIFNVAQSSIFVNQTGNTYDYKQNYHLKSSCPGHNYGTDGTDLGVYGTATPWKEGGVPYNPHIQFQSIATQTDGNGNLSVNIKVAAQKN